MHVAAGVIHDRGGRILIARRPDHLHQGGLWEFPGGKIEPGETPAQGLSRELREELDIEPLESSPLIRIRHAYPERRVLLDVWRVDRFGGTPKGMQGQPLRWVVPDELPAYEFPAANRPIVTAARLPDRYAILDDEAGDPETLRTRLHHLAATGIRMVQLRARGLAPHLFGAFAEYAAAFCRSSGIALLLNAEPEWVLRTGAAGVHLRAERLMALDRRPLVPPFWVAASCHDLDELRQAERIGADFAVLGPVLPTASHPGSRPLGWRAFAELTDAATLPIYALGGLVPADTVVARHHGAQGIAGIRGFRE